MMNTDNEQEIINRLNKAIKRVSYRKNKYYWVMVRKRDYITQGKRCDYIIEKINDEIIDNPEKSILIYPMTKQITNGICGNQKMFGNKVLKDVKKLSKKGEIND